MTDQEIGAALRRLREQAGLSQEAVARAMGVTPQHVSLMEHGSRRQRCEAVEAYATACGSEMQIVFGRSSPTVSEIVSLSSSLAPATADGLLQAVRAWARLTPEQARRLTRIAEALPQLRERTADVLTAAFEDAAVDVRP